MLSATPSDERHKPLLSASVDSVTNGYHAITTPASTAPSTAHTRPTIPTLTGLRAALMLHVLIRNMARYDPPDAVSWLVSAGAVGVSTFYCLSGFILAYCYGDHRYNTWRCYFAFIGRRYARLLPIYWLSQLMCLGTEVNGVKRYGWNGWSVLHWLALATGTQLWFPWPEYELSVYPAYYRGKFLLNRSLWALSVVLFFYVTFPLLMRAMRWCLGVERLSELPNSKSTSRLLLLFALCSAAVWLPLGLTMHNEDLNFALLTLPYFRLGEFGLGMVAAGMYISVHNRQQQQPQLQRETELEAPAQQQQTALIDRLAATPLLNSPLVLDIVMSATILLVILLARPSLKQQALFAAGNWLAVLLGYIILLLALSSSTTNSGRWGGAYKWLLTRPVVLELGAMSFCFYAFHVVPDTYTESLNLPPQRSVAVEFCAAVGLAWLGYKYVETPVYGWLSARLPVCRCHKE